MVRRSFQLRRRAQIAGIAAFYSGLFVDGDSGPPPAPVISLTVEGGAKAHNSTYDAGTPDEDEVVTLTVVVTNTGDAELTLVNATDSGAASAGAWDDTSVAPLGTATFDVTLDTSSAGAQTGYFEFTSNASPSPYRVNFEFEVLAPEIAVTVNAVSQADGSTFTPSNPVQGATVQYTVTATNNGTGDLELVNATRSGAVSAVSAWSSNTVAPGDSATCTITLTTASAGAQTGYFEFATNDETDGEDVYRVNVSYTVLAPVLQLRNAGDTVTIANGDATPDAADGTDFGNTPYSITVSKTFIIKNIGDASIAGINVLVPSGYTLTSAPSAAIVASGQTTFTVRCDAGSVAALAGNITVESTELADYVFAVTCNSQHPVDAFAWTVAVDAVETGAFQDSARTTVAGQGDPVGSFTDGSGNNRHLQQVTGTAKPTLTTDNGVVCLSFDGGDSLEKTGFEIAQPNTIINVFRLTSTGTNQTVFDSADVTKRNALTILAVGPQYRIIATTNLSGGTPNTSWHIAVAQFNGVSSFLRIDGVQVAAGDIGALSMNGIRLGLSASGGNPVTGFEAAKLVSDDSGGAMSLANIQAIEAYYLNEVLP